MYDEFNDFEMSVSVGATEIERQRLFLVRELEFADDRMETKLRRQFGLLDDESPETFTELLARIQAGKYVIYDDKKDKPSYNSGLQFIHWRDPAVKEDQKGFDVARKAMRTAKQDAERTIRVSYPKEGLAALKSFESATFQ